MGGGTSEPSNPGHLAVCLHPRKLENIKNIAVIIVVLVKETFWNNDQIAMVEIMIEIIIMATIMCRFAFIVDYDD